MAAKPSKKPEPYLFENLESRRVGGGESPYAEFNWTILHTKEQTLAEAMLLGATPLIVTTASGLVYRKDWTLDPDGRERWRGVVQYGPPDLADNREQMSFNVSGETIHITQALETIGKYRKAGETPVDFKGAIGVDKDGEVKGCDIITGKLSFSKTVYFPLPRVNDNFLKQLASVVGKVNAGPFKSFEPGEVLFTGCSGAPQWDQFRWEITYNFDCSPNVTNIMIGDIKVEAKLGWDYLWVQYEKIDDEEGKQIVARPLQANVERVYRFADFNQLGIGS